ncbi:MAG: NAD(P)-binding protein [Paracoccaceae bacterium]
MIRKEKNSSINREITFPIKIDGHTITASPGDSVASALYYSKKHLTIKTKLYHKSDLIFSKKMNELFSITPEYEIDLGFDEILDQEAYPGLEINSNNLFNNLSAKFLNKFSKMNSSPLNKFLSTFFLKKKNERLDLRIIESVEFISSQVLIVGSGVSGLLAASILVNAGMKVILLERDFILGGFFDFSNQNQNSWVKKLISNLIKSKNCKILKNTKLVHADGKNNFFAIRKFYYKNKTNSLKHKYKLLKIVVKNMIIATGLIERSLPNVDTKKTNIIVASKVHQLIYRFGLKVPNGVIVYTNNNFGWDTAFKLLSLGIEIQAIIDTRKNCNIPISCPVFRGAKIVEVYGNLFLKSIKILDNNGNIINMKTTYLIISGGFDLNLGSITKAIDSLKWCPKNLTFIPNKYTVNIDILSDFNNIYCINSLIKNTVNITSKILRDNKLKIKDYKFPIFEKQKLSSELLQYFDPNKNLRFYFFHNLKELISSRFTLKQFSRREENNELDNLKFNAIKLFSNDKLIQNDIKNNLFIDNKKNKIKLSFLKKEDSPINHSYNRLKSPYRLLKCNEFYGEIGRENGYYNGWLIPKFFYKNKNVQDESICVDNELSMTNTVGITDQSDLAKISIVGKDTIKVLKTIINLSEINFIKNRFFSFSLVKDNNLFFDSLLVLVISSEYVLILVHSQIENELYDYISSKLVKNQIEIKCEVYLESDIFQVFSLVGSFAHKFLINKFKIFASNGSLKLENRIFKFKYFDQDLFVLFQKINSDFYADIIINSSVSIQFLKDLYPELEDMNGGFIGRESYKKIKLDSGVISWNNFKKADLKLPISINTFETFKKQKFGELGYKIYSNEFIYSNMLCLIPIGLTQNVVKGSKVYNFKNGKQMSLLGEVIFCFYSRKIKKMISFIFLPDNTSKFDLVIVENISKNYQTLCKVKKYNELFSIIE